MKEEIITAATNTASTFPTAEMLEHPIKTALFFILLIFFVRELVVWFLGTGKIGDELKLIREELARIKTPKP